MKSGRPLALICAGIATAAIGGCTQTTPGTATSAPSDTNSASASGAAAAPKVSHPLPNIADYVSKTCDLVPAALISRLGFSDPTSTGAGDALGPGCSWVNTTNAHSKGLGVSVQTDGNKGNGGMAKIIKLNGSLYAFVEPTSISGYPAAYADSRDDRPQGKCGLFVGVTDDVTFAVDVQGYSGAQDSCDTVNQVAASVITTLRGG
ncbi:DUF3558 domain-containing protein [Amycolatopsis acididurans]|nr:DUF3558 domain-containing protein [Amycolatopsis acididurans]